MTYTKNNEIKTDNQKYAMIAVLLGSVAFSFGDAVVKLVSVEIVLWQILVLRAVLAIPALIVICRFRNDPIPLMPKLIAWTFARSALMVLMWLTYYGALLILPVTVAASVYYTMPIFLTLLAAILIGDAIRFSGWFAVFLGFLGVIITIQPDKSGFNLFTLLPLSSAIFFALAMIITRTKIRHEHPFVLTINLQFCFLLVGLLATYIVNAFDLKGATDTTAFFAGQWKNLDVWGWFIIILLAIAITVGNILTSAAYQNGKSSIIATLSFSYIPFVGLWAFLFFGEIPNFQTVVGVILIVSAGYITVRT